MEHELQSLAQMQSATRDALAAALAGDAADRSRGLREVASLLVEARSRFFTANGEPDWRGQSFAYRTWVREAMSGLPVDAETLARAQAAIRYHVSNVLHERLSGDELEAAGLRDLSARERSAEKRERHGETVNLFSPGGGPIETAEDLVAVAERMLAVLGRVSLPLAAMLPAKDRRRVGAAFERVATHAAALGALNK